MPSKNENLPFSAFPILWSQCLSCVKQSIQVILLITVFAVPEFHHGHGWHCAKCFRLNTLSFSVMITLHANQMFLFYFCHPCVARVNLPSCTTMPSVSKWRCCGCQFYKLELFTFVWIICGQQKFSNQSTRTRVMSLKDIGLSVKLVVLRCSWPAPVGLEPRQF